MQIGVQSNEGWWFIDNSTLQNQIIEGIIQTIFWAVSLTILRHWIRSFCENKEFYKYASAQAGGSDEFLGWITAIPNHTTSAMLIWIGMRSSRPDIFRSACLAEFGYETFDLLNLYVQRFILKNKPTADKKNAALLIYAMTFHHLPGILVIIPAVNAFGEDRYFQETVWSLLSYTPCMVGFIVLYKTCNVNDLNGRTQFTVYYLMNALITFYGRFLWCPVTMYQFLIHSLLDKNIYIQCLCIFYGLLIYAFNILIIVVTMQRGYGFMFKTKNKEHENVKAAKLLRKTSSTEIFGAFIQNKFRLDLLRNHLTPKHKFKASHSCSNLQLQSKSQL